MSCPQACSFSFPDFLSALCYSLILTLSSVPAVSFDVTYSRQTKTPEEAPLQLSTNSGSLSMDFALANSMTRLLGDSIALAMLSPSRLLLRATGEFRRDDQEGRGLLLASHAFDPF
jgi:hypothetical protein